MPIICAGTASTDITPPVGLPLVGDSRLASTGILHPLSAQALFLTDGFEGALLLCADVISFDTPYAEAIRTAVARRCGVPVGHVLLAATGTHSGPVTDSQWSVPNDAYRARLHRQLVDLAAQAAASPQPVEIAARYGACAGITINRKGDDGPVDEQAGVVRLDTPDGRPLAALVNYACPPVTLHGDQGLISPDFPHLVRARIREALNPDMEVFFLTGTCADLAPVAADSALAAFRHTGNTLGAAALHTLQAALPDRTGAFAAIAGDTLHALRFGPAALLTLPGQLPHACGQQLKAASPHPVTLIAAQVNGHEPLSPEHTVQAGQELLRGLG